MNDGGQEVAGIVQQHLNNPFPMTYISLGENGGKAAASNLALKVAKGDYIGFLDDDHELFPLHYYIMANVLNTCPEVNWTLGACKHTFWQDGKVIQEGIHTHHPPDKDLCLLKNWMTNCCQLVRRETMDAVGHFDPTMRHADDWDFNIRLMWRGGKSAWVPEPITANVHYDYDERHMTTVVNLYESAEEWTRIMTKHARYATPQIRKEQLESMASLYEQLEPVQRESLMAMWQDTEAEVGTCR